MLFSMGIFSPISLLRLPLGRFPLSFNYENNTCFQCHCWSFHPLQRKHLLLCYLECLPLSALISQKMLYRFYPDISVTASSSSFSLLLNFRKIRSSLFSPVFQLGNTCDLPFLFKPLCDQTFCRCALCFLNLLSWPLGKCKDFFSWSLVKP